MTERVTMAESSEAATGRKVVLRVNNVHKKFGSFVALEGVSLRVHEGDVLVIIGPSGSGKSTLARCINQLESIDAGSILLDDELLGFSERRGHLRALSPRELAHQRRRMGMVFQHFNLFPHLTALENIADPQIRCHGISREAARERARELLQIVGLTAKEKSYPIMLSGGEQQRVAIARALAAHPRILLFDEPTSALDPELVDEVMAVIKDVAAHGRTMVVVTHDLAFARDVADWCIFMERGRIVEQGRPGDLFQNPETDRLRAFLTRHGSISPKASLPAS
jgi:polar amino acid transport system ATP-binding protein